MENPFDIRIYNKNFGFEGYVVDPGFAYFVPAWRDQGYGNFMLDANNPHSEALQAKGARIVCRYKGEHILSGPVRSRRGSILPNESVTYQVSDDRRLIRNTLAYINPAEPLLAATLTSSGQVTRPDGGTNTSGSTKGQWGYFLWPDGSAATGGFSVDSAEAAIKHIIRVNLVTRLGRPVVIEPDLGRGGNIRAAGALPDVRFETLEEVIEPILDWAGLGLRMWQPVGGTAIHIDVYEPGEWVQPLTPESGIIRFGEYSVNGPNITRPIMGGPGTTVARAWQGQQGLGNQTQRETDYNDVIEVFRDAPAKLTWPDAVVDANRIEKFYTQLATASNAASFVKQMAKMEAAAMLAGAPTSGLSLTLAETETFHFGGTDGVQIGDMVTVKAQNQTFTNRIHRAEMSFTRDDGLKITPVVGNQEDDPDKIVANSIAALAKALRNTHTSK